MENPNNPQASISGLANNAPSGSVPVVSASTTQYPNQVQPVSQTSLPPQDNSAPPTKKPLPLNKILIGVLGVVIVGLIGFFAYKFFTKPEAPKEITLTYWGLWEDSPILQSVISEYEAKTPNVKIKYLKQAKEDYRERLNNSFAKGDGPDIFRFHNTWVPMLGSGMSSLPAAVMDRSTFEKTFYPVAVRDLSRGSDLVGIPLMYDGLALYINEDILNSSGELAPTNWNEFRDLAAKLTIRDQDGAIQQAGAALGITDNVDHWEDILTLMMLQAGVDMASPSGTLAGESLTFYTLFYTEDRVWDETFPPSTQAFASGKLAMYFGPSWESFEIKQINPELKYRIVPVPQIAKETPSFKPDVTYASYWAEGVSEKSKNQEEAWKFLAYLSEKSVLEKLYKAQSETRLFGEPYPRQDMAGLMQDDPNLGAFIKSAPTSQSWYLSSKTYDGPTGINSRIANYFKDGINTMLKDRREAADVLPTVAVGVGQVLSSYQTTPRK